MTVQTQCAVWTTDAGANLIMLLTTIRLLPSLCGSLPPAVMHLCMLPNRHIHNKRQIWGDLHNVFNVQGVVGSLTELVSFGF